MTASDPDIGQGLANGHSSALFTDLYELTMSQSYDDERMDEPAVFELFYRKLPASRNYLIAAGIADVLDFLESFHFTSEDLDYLRSLRLFSERFLRRLAGLRFTGDVFALPEGTPVFPLEPLVQVVAPLLEAQLIETMLLNQVHFQTLVAGKAARVVSAAEGRGVVEFGSRRAHGVDAAVKVARIAYQAGAIGTSNMLAGRLHGIPVFGTMAHSYVQAHDDELEAFATFARAFPGTTLLVDTYDTLDGVRRVIELARRLGDQFSVKAVRLDSGDLAELARQSRQLLDAAGLRNVTIFASSGLDEHKIARLVEVHAPIDAFGVGTKLAVSGDAPSLDMAYKLVEYAGRPRTKFSTDKLLLPGRKQVFRVWSDGHIVEDTLGAWDERLSGEPMLQQVMRRGERTSAGRVSLASVRAYTREQWNQLPDSLKSLAPSTPPFPVRVSGVLQRKLDELRPPRPA